MNIKTSNILIGWNYCSCNTPYSPTQNSISQCQLWCHFDPQWWYHSDSDGRKVAVMSSIGVKWRETLGTSRMVSSTGDCVRQLNSSILYVGCTEDSHVTFSVTTISSAAYLSTTNRKNESAALPRCLLLLKTPALSKRHNYGYTIGEGCSMLCNAHTHVHQRNTIFKNDIQANNWSATNSGNLCQQ